MILMKAMRETISHSSQMVHLKLIISTEERDTMMTRENGSCLAINYLYTIIRKTNWMR